MTVQGFPIQLFIFTFLGQAGECNSQKNDRLPYSETWEVQGEVWCIFTSAAASFNLGLACNTLLTCKGLTICWCDQSPIVLILNIFFGVVTLVVVQPVIKSNSRLLQRQRNLHLQHSLMRLIFIGEDVISKLQPMRFFFFVFVIYRQELFPC